MMFTAEYKELATKLAQILVRKELFFSTAESCTGGLVAALCTELQGSSAWFLGGITAYANSVKEAVLDVPASILNTHGAVSQAVVEAMASGALSALGSSVAVSISGVAGPDGGTKEKPIGTVWIGLAIRQNKDTAPIIKSELHLFTGNRQEIRLAAVKAALELALRFLS